MSWIPLADFAAEVSKRLGKGYDHDTSVMFPQNWKRQFVRFNSPGLMFYLDRDQRDATMLSIDSILAKVENDEIFVSMDRVELENHRARIIADHQSRLGKRI